MFDCQRIVVFAIYIVKTFCVVDDRRPLFSVYICVEECFISLVLFLIVKPQNKYIFPGVGFTGLSYIFFC